MLLLLRGPSLWKMCLFTTCNPSRYEGVYWLLEGTCPLITVPSPIRNPGNILSILQSVLETLVRSNIHPPIVCWNRSTKVEIHGRISNERELLTIFFQVFSTFLAMSVSATISASNLRASARRSKSNLTFGCHAIGDCNFSTKELMRIFR